MFRRRRRGSSHHQQPLSSSSALSAQSAASHAFLKSNPSSSSLSAAAAATALRTLTPPPTNVENVQTKRTLQRQSSFSQYSRSSSLRPASRNDLRRSNSSSSMSTRTFREQSPRRPVSSSGSLDNMPPIPSIPKEYAPARSTPVRRSVSVGPSTRSSPPVKCPSGRGASMDRENMRCGSPRLTPVPEIQRAGSRNSINFSYPMSSRPTSPSIPPDALDIPDTSIGASLADKLSTLATSQPQSSLSQTANTSARQRTRNPSPGSPGKAAPPVTTAVAAAQAAIVPRSDEGASPQTPSAPREPDVQLPAPFQIAGQPDPRQPVSRPAFLNRPSTVPEDPKGEERAEAGAPAKSKAAPPSGSVKPENPSRVKPSPTPESAREPHAHLSSVVSSSESMGSTEPGHGVPPSLMRKPSSSPGSSARFSTQLSVSGFPGRSLHKPPPRSVSPAKSAMKSPRSSLSPDGRTAGVLRPGPPLSEISDGTSYGSDDGSKPGFRKRHPKVSFDDEAEIVGVAASPPTSPEDAVPDAPLPGCSKAKSKSGWFGLGKRRAHAWDIVGSDEFDAVLKPRPTLPSFGSIRGAREGEQGEPSWHEPSDNESTTSSEPNLGAPTWSASNDHVLGAIISNAEPKDTTAGHTNDDSEAASLPTSTSVRDTPSNHSTTDPSNGRTIDPARPQGTSDAHGKATDGPAADPTSPVPGIAVQPATPEFENKRSNLEWYTVPGGFPRSSVESKGSTSRRSKKTSSQTAGNSTAVTPESDGGDDESGGSIYSDAEEDLEGDGFGSINAIVDGKTEDKQIASSSHNGGADRSSNNTPDIPKTCQIARVEIPVQPMCSPPPPRSPASPREPLPLSSRSPVSTPPSDITTASKIDGVPHSSATNRTRRSMSGDGYKPPVTRDGVERVGKGILFPRTEDGAPQPRVRAGQEQAKKRPVSWGGALLEEQAVSGKEQQAHGTLPSQPQRRLSNGSDSSSSFVRTYRPTRASPQHTLRRTMRGGSPPPSGRAASPVQQKFPPAEVRPRSAGSSTGALRPTLRASEPRREKPSFFSTGKMQRSTAQTWKSRFEDSSDEDEQGIGNLRPVRGIPRRAGKYDGDSTELEDSSDNERHLPAARTVVRQPDQPGSPRNSPALGTVANSRGMTEREAEEFLRRAHGERKPSLFHRIGIRRPKPPTNRPGPAKLGKPDPKPKRVHEEQPLPLDPNQGSFVTTITANNSVSPATPRVLKRGTHKSSGSETWPLRTNPQEPGNGSNNMSGRPQTADAAAQNGNADVVDKAAPVFKENEIPVVKSDRLIVSDVGFTPGRKKRFPKIRKAFGLSS
ncbi:hypothetical protein EYZ11_009372 [Aspergillus tanneri]|uniref:Uncharacterized protein n=1 Tax=Aspergillus tanneri TaxID=1220188 RepID=A0A4S3J815_9EURO|nr:uncharacterized protein ATNIH1004_005795 [Aspergillus tanneri]KAA8647112.1 hypothetical protein ATNIH1004_005795 [Aspergillus tanneri]THC91159.1 hypothetical protein EYZ11_009372 [Aspergillus tanneri]